jgi:hypothetical protein
MQHPPPLDADGRLEAAIQQAQRAASARADRLPVRLVGSAAPPPALAAKIRAAIEPFVGDVIGKMVAICAFLPRVTASGRFGIRAKRVLSQIFLIDERSPKAQIILFCQ